MPMQPSPRAETVRALRPRRTWRIADSLLRDVGGTGARIAKCGFRRQCAGRPATGRTAALAGAAATAWPPRPGSASFTGPRRPLSPRIAVAPDSTGSAPSPGGSGPSPTGRRRSSVPASARGPCRGPWTAPPRRWDGSTSGCSAAIPRRAGPHPGRGWSGPAPSSSSAAALHVPCLRAALGCHPAFGGDVSGAWAKAAAPQGHGPRPGWNPCRMGGRDGPRVADIGRWAARAGISRRGRPAGPSAGRPPRRAWTRAASPRRARSTEAPPTPVRATPPPGGSPRPSAPSRRRPLPPHACSARTTPAGPRPGARRGAVGGEACRRAGSRRHVSRRSAMRVVPTSRSAHPHAISFKPHSSPQCLASSWTCGIWSAASADRARPRASPRRPAPRR